MAPETLQRKLEHLNHYLKELEKFRGSSYEAFMQRHFEVERLLERLATAAIDIVFHLLAEKNEETPATYATGFLRAGEIDLLPKDLAASLAKAAGLRNILAHGYADIDLVKVPASIDPALNDFRRLITVLKR